MNERSFTILICTAGRAAHLQATLASIARCSVPGGTEGELIVVDNAPAEDTAAVVSAAEKISSLPVRYVAEPRRGKGYAYNTAVSVARGTALLMTDDDVRVPEDWIEGMCGRIWAGECEAVAGGIRVAEHLHRPWMETWHRNALASTEWMGENDPTLLVGANMAIARSVFETVPAFDVELGPGALGSDEETLVCRQMLEAGMRVARRLDVLVEHHPDLSRLKRSSFLKTAENHGRSAAYVDHHWEHRDASGTAWKAMRAKLRLELYRLRRSADCRVEEGAAGWEFGMVRELAYAEQMAIESRRPRNYARRGLRKVAGVLADVGERAMPVAAGA